MKSKWQKRLEAIERLEKEPQGKKLSNPDINRIWFNRRQEAKRLRKAFGLEQPG